MLEFRRLTFSNFRSFRDKTSVKLVDGAELVYITGKNDAEPELGANGSGKSSLVEALHWCLFGKTSDGLRAGDVATWDSSATTKAILRVAVDGIEHRIHRTWRPNDLLFDHRRVDQATLESELGISSDTFCHSIFHAQFFVHFADLPPAVQMDIYSTLLRLDVWEEAAKRSSDSAKQERGETQQLAVENASIRGKLSELGDELQKRSEQEMQWWRDQKMLVARYDRQHKEAQKRLKQATSGLEKASQRRTKISYRKLDKLNSQRDSLRNRLAGCRTLISSNRSMIEQQDRALLKLRDGEPCPLCQQPTDLAHIRRHAEKSMKQWETQIGELNKQAAGLAEELKNLDSQIETEQTIIREEDRRQSKAIGEAEAEKRAARDALDQIAHEENRLLNEQCPYDTTEMRKRRDEMRERWKEGKQLERQTRWLAETHEFWIKGFREIRLALISESLMQLELATNDALSALGLSDWAVEFSAEMQTKGGKLRKAFTIMVRSPHNSKPVPFSSWSGGERQRLRLAITLGLSDVIQDFAGVDSNLEVFDEPTQHLSREGIQQLLELLSERARERERSIWLIDHRVFASGSFSRIITCRKDRVGSRILAERGG